MIDVGILLSVGNVVSLMASFPQLKTAYNNRKNLAGLSSKFLMGFMIASALWAICGYETLPTGVLSLVINVAVEGFYAIQLYWKFKYR